MTSLLDIAPSARTIPAGGINVPVFGVSAAGIAALMTDFPDLKNMFVGGALKFDVPTLVAVAPKAIAAIIAAGTGSASDPAAIQIAANLPVGKQMEFLETIVELTMPDGIAPFMEALDRIVNRLDFESLGKAPASKSPSPSKV